MIMKNGFRVGGSTAKFEVRNKTGSSLSECVDGQQMVLNLSSSQKHITWDWFLTFTCNQAKHFGMKFLKLYLATGKWKECYPDFYKKTVSEQEEIAIAMEHAFGSIIFRQWIQVRKLFLEYLLHSITSKIGPVANIFARDEYQKDSGN
eukprot:880090-Ditylum_brightwellii.AAC.1